MSISSREVQQIAALARLEFEGEEERSMARDLGSILDHIQDLRLVDVQGVEPMGGVSDHPAPMRSDEPAADPLRHPVESFAPVWNERFFVVPRLEALDADAPDLPESEHS